MHATTRHRWQWPLIAIFSLIASLFAIAPAAADHDGGPPSTTLNVAPIVDHDNPDCADFIPGSIEFKPDGNGVGTHPINQDGLTGSVTVTQGVSDANGPTYDFQFTGTIGAEGVVVKGGNPGNFFDYRTQPGGGTQHDTGLHPPINPSNGTYFGLSHISFCLVDLLFPSTTLSLDASGPLTVYAGSSVVLDATETNDGNVDLTNAHVDYSDNVACAGGNQKPDPAQATLAANGGVLNASCTFVAPEGTTVVTVIGHGTFDGKDVTFCQDPGAADPATTICDQDEIDQITIVGINPSTDLDLNLGSSSPATQTGTDPTTYTVNVDFGGDVDLSFIETNDGGEVDDTLTNVSIEFVNGVPECEDTAGGVTLAPTETHTVDCATLTNLMAHRTITAIGHGTDALGNDVTWCEDPASPPAGVLCDQDEIVVVNIVVDFGEGCTPGLWGQYDNEIGKGKNAGFHWIRDEWAASPYSFGDNAGAAFGVSVWDAFTLGELTNRGGGGEAALGRSASAALQNILHADISYFGYPSNQAGADQLIGEVQAAFAAGTDEAIEELKDRLDALNNEGDCTLSND